MAEDIAPNISLLHGIDKKVDVLVEHVSGLKDKLDTHVMLSVADRERLRIVERFQWKIVGGFSVLIIVFGYLAPLIHANLSK